MRIFSKQNDRGVSIINCSPNQSSITLDMLVLRYPTSVAICKIHCVYQNKGVVLIVIDIYLFMDTSWWFEKFWSYLYREGILFHKSPTPADVHFVFKRKEGHLYVFEWCESDFRFKYTDQSNVWVYK